MSSVEDELYKQLTKAADDLIEELGRPISLMEALLQLIASLKLEPSDFFWSSRINETGSKKIAQHKNPVPRNTRCTNRHE